MKKLITTLAFAVLTMGFAQTAMFTVTYSHPQSFDVGAEISTMPLGPVEVVAGFATDVETRTDVYLYAGHRIELWAAEEETLYFVTRAGILTAWDSVFTTPDAYRAVFGIGGLDDASMLEAGIFVDTADFQSYDYSATVSVGFGVGR